MTGRIPRTVWPNTVVVVAATLITAVAGLVIEDLLPNDPAKDPDLVRGRVIMLGVLIGLLFGALWWRARVHRTTGTLFQVQVLDEGYPDKLAESREQAERDRMAVFSITRRVDLRCRRAADGVVDVVDLTQDLSDILEEQINNDLGDTGYTVAPAMPWPMALAMGTQLPLGDRLRLLELQAQDGRPINEVALAERAGARTLHKEELKHGDDPEAGRLARRRRAGGRPRRCRNHGDDPEAGRLAVWIALTESAAAFDLAELSPFGVTKVHRLTLGPNVPRDPKLTDADLAGLAPALAKRLTEVKGQALADDRDLVVVAMMPKIIGMAVGWHLSQEPCRFFERTHLLWFDPSERQLRPMRVKESQPATMSAPVDA